MKTGPIHYRRPNRSAHYSPRQQLRDHWREVDAVDGCAALLRQMLVTGQHRWSLPDAQVIAGRIGLKQPVKAGIGA